MRRREGIVVVVVGDESDGWRAEGVKKKKMEVRMGGVSGMKRKKG